MVPGPGRALEQHLLPRIPAAAQAADQRERAGHQHGALSASGRQDRVERVIGLCQGARNGQEVRLLKARLGTGVRVHGTDISPSARAIEDMTQWDFHDLHHDWTGRTDFIYSNSWDHTYDIDRLAHAWAATLAPGGLAIIHWTKFHTEAGMNDGPDMFGTGEDEIASVFTHAGLRELDRVRLAHTNETNDLKIEVPAEPTAPHADGGVVQAHYVEHDGEVVLIPLLRDPS